MNFYQQMYKKYPLDSADTSTMIGVSTTYYWTNIDGNGLYLELVWGSYRFRAANGQYHRWDGPAIINTDYTSWFWNGVCVAKLIKIGDKYRYVYDDDKKIYLDWFKKNDIDLFNLSEDDVTLIKMNWA